jgi:hypothetical protein
VAITVYPLCIPFYYFLLMSRGDYERYLIGFVLVLIFVLACGSFAFVLNTLCDLVQDAACGKYYALSTWKRISILRLLAVLSGACFLTAILLGLSHKSFLLLAALEYAISIAYSARPIRLKESPILGPLAISLSQFAIPQLLVGFVFDPFAVGAILFGAMFFLVGLRAILFHQILDISNDLEAGVVTFVTRFGVQKTWQILLYAVVPTEVGLLAVILFVIDAHVVGMLIYTGTVMALYWICKRTDGSVYSLMSVFPSFLVEYYLMFWPVFLLLYGSFKHWIFAVLLVVHGCATASFWSPYAYVLRGLLNRLRSRY